MTALQTEFSGSSIAVESDVHGFVWTNSGNRPTEKTREDEIPKRVITRLRRHPLDSRLR